MSKQPLPDYYEVLGVSPTADQAVIEAAYRALMKKYHPDLWQGHPSEALRQSQLLNAAYRVLKSSERRAEYDRSKAEHKSSEREINQNQKTEQMPREKLWLYGLFILVCTIILGFYGIIKYGNQVRDASAEVAPETYRLMDEERSFCITNNTYRAVSFTLDWGAKSEEEVLPLTSRVFRSRASADPVVSFISSISVEEVQLEVAPRASAECEPNYSFEYKDLQLPGQARSPYDRYGLYRSP